MARARCDRSAAAAELQVETTPVLQIPRFAYREVLSAEGEDKAFRAHNLLNGESHGRRIARRHPVSTSGITTGSRATARPISGRWCRATVMRRRTRRGMPAGNSR
jgi:hypothetical protein